MIDGNLAEFAAIVTSDQHRSFHLPLRRIYNLDAQINVSITGGAAKLCFPPKRSRRTATSSCAATPPRGTQQFQCLRSKDVLPQAPRL